MLIRLALIAALVAAACAPETVTPTPTPSPTPPSPSPTASPSPAAVPGDMTETLRANVLPEADQFDLARRLAGRDGMPAEPFVPVRDTPPDEDAGDVSSFWVYDFDTRRNERISATLAVMGTHAKWWLQEGISVDLDDLEETARVFDEEIYPTNRELYGPEWSPGIDGDERVNVLVADIPGRAAGYFNLADELPRWVNEFSAERELMYINARAARFASDSLYATLAHEFCHMQQFNTRTRSAAWFNEGQAQLCERANGYETGFEQAFLRQPDTQLNDWPELDDRAILHYGGSFLFLEFLRTRVEDGDAFIRELMLHGVDRLDDFDEVLRGRGDASFEELFADFVAANALIGTARVPARYAYSTLKSAAPAGAASADRLALGDEVERTVRQHAARYLELPRADQTVTFAGAATARLLPTEPRSGRAFWWSDRGDAIDSRLTRTVDLSAVATATLGFWTWYDIEADFDYAYVAVSDDEGASWTTLRTEATTTADPNGNNFGNGLTGTSGGAEPVWIRQTADLTPWAGARILLRFEHVTDGALNEEGIAIDDVEIPAIAFHDDAESESGWIAEGFVRSSNVVRQRYLVQVIRFGDTPTVERHVVDGRPLEIEVLAADDRLPPILAVSGLAASTRQPAPFTVRVAE